MMSWIKKKAIMMSLKRNCKCPMNYTNVNKRNYRIKIKSIVTWNWSRRQWWMIMTSLDKIFRHYLNSMMFIYAVKNMKYSKLKDWETKFMLKIRIDQRLINIKLISFAPKNKWKIKLISIFNKQRRKDSYNIKFKRLKRITKPRLNPC